MSTDDTGRLVPVTLEVSHLPKQYEAVFVAAATSLALPLPTYFTSLRHRRASKLTHL